MDVVNSKILLNLDYPDIINACKGVPAFYKLCNDPYFWALKAEYDFGIPSSELPLVPGSNNKKRYEFIYKLTDPTTGLIEAAKVGSLYLVKYFLNQGADLHTGDIDLLELVNNEYNNIGIIKYLFKEGVIRGMQL